MHTESDGSIPVTKIWNASLTTGKYDIVVDTNQNGEWNEGEPIDDEMDVGFEAIPEFPTVAIPLSIMLLIAFFFLRRKSV